MGTLEGKFVMLLRLTVDHICNDIDWKLINVNCPLYDQEPETCDHIFVSCSYTLEVWWRMLSTIGG